MVSLDPYINETTRHADIILPPTSPLEHDHYDLAFHVNAIRNTVRHSEAVFEKPADALHDWEIFTELGNRVAALLGTEAAPSIAPDQIMDMGIQMGPYSASQGSDYKLTMDVVRASPSGIDLGPLQPQLPQRLHTKDKLIDCATPQPLADLARLREEFCAPTPTHSLQLIGRRHVRSNNSWMHNYHPLIKGKNRCTLMMHPQDMQGLNLEDGATVTVRSRVGSVEVPLEACEEIMPGVVSLPHGYGHHRPGIKLELAQANAGVSCNDLTDELALDALSGNAALNGVPVTVVAQ